MLTKIQTYQTKHTSTLKLLNIIEHTKNILKTTKTTKHAYTY